MAKNAPDPGTGTRQPPATTKPPVTGAPVFNDGKKSNNTGQAYNDFIQKHPVMRAWSDTIWQMSQEYNVDPVYIAALIFKESGGNPNAKNKSGAFGLGQIMPFWVGKKGPDGKVITKEMYNNPRWQIRFAAWLTRKGLEDGATYQNVYEYGGPWAYNNGAPKGANPYSIVPKNYTFKGWRGGRGTPGVGDPAADAATQAANKADPYVTGVNKKGKLTTYSGAEPPAKGLTIDGRPIRRSEFLQIKRQWEDIFVSYTGQRPKNNQIQNIIKNGWGEYTVMSLLTKGKNFEKSPIWKAKSPAYEAAAKDLLAPGQKLDKNLVKKAILNGWDTSIVQAELRKGQGYTESNEFKGTTATMANVYQSIYGVPGSGGMGVIKEASLAGWSPDQFASWLRSRDEYVYTPEYRAKAVSLVEALGFMTGKVATLQSPGPAAIAPPSGNPVGFGPLPDDPRIKGTGQLPGANDTVPLVAGVQR